MYRLYGFCSFFTLFDYFHFFLFFGSLASYCPFSGFVLAIFNLLLRIQPLTVLLVLTVWCFFTFCDLFPFEIQFFKFLFSFSPLLRVLGPTTSLSREVPEIFPPSPLIPPVVSFFCCGNNNGRCLCGLKTREIVFRIRRNRPSECIIAVLSFSPSPLLRTFIAHSFSSGNFIYAYLPVKRLEGAKGCT